MTRIMIDDRRSRKDVDIIFRNSDSVYYFLARAEDLKITELLLDNDLGLDSDEGWEILKYIFEFVCFPLTITILTQNPVARNHIINIIMDTKMYKEVISNSYFVLKKAQ